MSSSKYLIRIDDLEMDNDDSDLSCQFTFLNNDISLTWQLEYYYQHPSYILDTRFYFNDKENFHKYISKQDYKKDITRLRGVKTE
jgi:hypothetical protein